MPAIISLGFDNVLKPAGMVSATSRLRRRRDTYHAGSGAGRSGLWGGETDAWDVGVRPWHGEVHSVAFGADGDLVGERVVVGAVEGDGREERERRHGKNRSAEEQIAFYESTDESVSRVHRRLQCD